MPFYHMEKVLIGILYSPVKWRDNRVKVDKILFIKTLHMVVGNGALMKQDENQGCLKPSYVPSAYDLCLG